MNLKIISAGAGSGKTYRLTQEMVNLLRSGVRASGIIATTFTTKAAAELQERVRVKLLEEGLTDAANDLTNALIGTVHGLGVKLLKRFAFEAGVSPEVAIIADEDQQILFNKSLATILTNERIQVMEQYSNRLGLNKKEPYDWRKEVKQLTDAARSNDFSIEILVESKQKSFESLEQFLEPVSKDPPAQLNSKLQTFLASTIEALENNEDATKVTESAVTTLKTFVNILHVKGELNWHEWVKISKIKVGAKSRGEVEALQTFALEHDAHPEFRKDIKNFIYAVFDIAIAALKEYDLYKKQRGLIDYIDMEIHVKRLLDNPVVVEVLADELDLLMVDEFQDTSPIQLEIFYKLSKIANHSIWVGDPKQSIYGFRGADPKLMLAIITQTGGIKAEDIQEKSWRSREDIVHLTNALFTKAFDDLPAEQIALKPVRTKKVDGIEMDDAIIHWHFQYDGEGRLPGRPWIENSIAHAVKILLERRKIIKPKEEAKERAVLPGDIAILCRSNYECQEVAEALHRAGLKAAISRVGLLATAEAKLMLACLKFILNKSDSLSVAEILLLASDIQIEKIIDDRLDYLELRAQNKAVRPWAAEDSIIQMLNDLRPRVVELSSAEILNLLIEQLALRRIIMRWGKVQQRMDNIDVIRKFALQYEETCNRLHTAASLGGFLLWLNELESAGKDTQGSGEGSDSVNVLTYHKSKGLEWPVVICHSLEGALRDNIWGLNLVAEKEEVDLENILGNRWLRYWINPYADQQNGTSLLEKINASPVKTAITQAALNEEARLLYVGITRARDYLIFPTKNNPTRWLNRCWHKGIEDHPTIIFDDHETPWEWNKQMIVKDTWSDLIFPRDFTHTDRKEDNIQYFEKSPGSTSYHPYQIDLSAESFNTEFTYQIVEKEVYHAPVKVEEEADVYQVAKAFKAFLTADDLAYENVARLQMAKNLIDRYEIGEDAKPERFVQNATAFYKKLEERFEIIESYRKYPIRYFYKKRLFEKIIDLVLKTKEGIILIQNSGFHGGQDKWEAKIQKGELPDFLFLSKKAIQEIFDTRQVKTYVHFVLGAGLVAIEVESRKMVGQLKLL
ncbi:MAG: ATP-dependent helicase/nuclease subunit A [Saprospiraceae bacterium]|jgi:ATP-dependent helicase/nuclease subunit A